MTAPTDPAELNARVAQIEREILSRAPEHDIVPTLDRVSAVLDVLGRPQDTFRIVHLTGTNGKTSTTRLVEALLREHGLRTGRFTSPHLHSMRERISVDGQPVSESAFVEAWEELAPIIELQDAASKAQGGPRLTFFEVLVILAYAVFADAPVDVAVVEVGMGGRWDATNAADGDVAVLTPIDIDHTHFLGPDLESIAAEKVGIVKPGASVVTGPQDPEVMEIIQERCRQVGARLYALDAEFGITDREVALGGQLISVRGVAGSYNELFVPLHGAHQGDNAALAVAAVELLLGGGERPLDSGTVGAGLATATSPGRLEVVRRSPTILVDAAHNPHGMVALREALAEAFSVARLVGVVAIFADKDAAAMLEALEPALDHVVVTRNSSPRSADPHELGTVAADIFGTDRVTVVASLPDALERAVTIAEADGLGGGVVATGSVVTAADVRLLLGVTDS